MLATLNIVQLAIGFMVEVVDLFTTDEYSKISMDSVYSW